MKFVLPSLVALVCALAACKTTSDRRDLYSPDKPQGPATAELRDWTLFGNNNHKSTTSSYPVAEAGEPQETGPIAPPPPPPPDGSAPDSSIGAPEPTPLPGAVPANAPAPLPARLPRAPVAAPKPAASSDAIPVATPTDAGGGGSAGGDSSGGGDNNIPGLSQ